jgi:hypothetical protein
MDDDVTPSGTRFPAIQARDLQGKGLDIPADLPGKVNLVLLAFLREHQYPIESWLSHLAQLEQDFPGLEVWEVPALAKSYRIFRGAIDGGMRAGIADPDARTHTLTAYLDLRSLQRALALPDLEDIQLYLLDGSGTIRWHASGAWTGGKLAGLTEALRGILP